MRACGAGRRGGVCLLALLLALVSQDARAKPAKRRVRRGYPSTCKVDAFVDAARSMSPAARLTKARRIIAYVIESDVAEDDPRDPIEVWEYFLGRWAALARETGDPKMLTAIDEADVDAGYALSTCLFYRRVTDIPAFAEHYTAADARRTLGRCWYGDELRKVLVEPPEPTLRRELSRDPIAKACDTDRQIDRLAKLKLRERKAGVDALIERARELRDTDPVGGFYLEQRLPSLFTDG